MSHDYGAVGQRGGTIYKCSVCCRVFYNVYRRKCFTGTAADGAAYTGDGFYKGHNWLSMDSINICRGRLDSERRLKLLRPIRVEVSNTETLSLCFLAIVTDVVEIGYHLRSFGSHSVLRLDDYIDLCIHGQIIQRLLHTRTPLVRCL